MVLFISVSVVVEEVVSVFDIYHTIEYDWDIPSTSYSWQVQFIHTEGVWHTLHVVGGHKDVTPHHTITLRVVGLVEER